MFQTTRYWRYRVVRQSAMRLSSTIIGLLLLTVSGCASILAHERPLTCVPPEGSLDVAVQGGGEREEGIGEVYHWTSTAITLDGPQKFIRDWTMRPKPWTTTRGLPSWEKNWKISQTGVEQSLLGSESKLGRAYAVSPDGRWLASAVYPGKKYDYLTERLALIDRHKQQVVHVLEVPQYIEALAWAPSGHTLAVYTQEYVKVSSFQSIRRLVGNLFGKPPTFSTVQVAFYDLKGQQLCEQLFEEKVSPGSGYLIWHPDED